MTFLPIAGGRGSRTTQKYTRATQKFSMRGFKGGLRILFYLLAAINQTAYMTQLFISSVNLFDSAFTVALFPLLIYMLVAFSNADGNNITCNFVPLIFLHQDVSFTPFHPVYCFFCIFPGKTQWLLTALESTLH